jgi:hypothetical protein
LKYSIYIPQTAVAANEFEYDRGVWLNDVDSDVEKTLEYLARARGEAINHEGFIDLVVRVNLMKGDAN